MNSEQITRSLDEAFDQALLFHGYAEFMRDYDLYVYATADPRSGVEPEHLRYRFTHCVQATVATTVREDVWQASLADEFTDYEAWERAGEPEGYVWGVNWSTLYPGMRLQAESEKARRWSGALRIQMHEALIETNAHSISLVFADLLVEKVEPGVVPFAVPALGSDGKFAL